MTLNEIENKINELETRLFYLDMADRLWGKEKEEYENLHREIIHLYHLKNEITNN